MLAWFLWKSRNDARFNSMQTDAAEIVRRDLSLMNELRTSPVLAYDSQQFWEKPRKGWFKANVGCCYF